MKRLFSAFKAVLVVMMAGVLLLTTACSNATTQAKTDGGEVSVPGQVQPYEGGMNNFRDVDPTRLDTSGSDAKAKALKDRVERNIETKRVEGVDDLVDNVRANPIDRKAKQLGDDIKRGTENIKDDLQNITDKGSANVQRNLEKAPREVGKAVDQAADNAKQAGRNAVEGVQDLGDKASKVGQRAGEAIDDITDDVQRAVDRAANLGKANVDDAANAAKRALKDAA
jgi:gas vesicle protein